jgi:hypothetical protein
LLVPDNMVLLTGRFEGFLLQACFLHDHTGVCSREWFHTTRVPKEEYRKAQNIGRVRSSAFVSSSAVRLPLSAVD